MGKIIHALLFLLPFSCTLYARNNGWQNTLEEMRIALMDVRKAYGEQKLELELLQEKIATMHLNQDLEARIAELEKAQEKIFADLRRLTAHANQTTQTLTSIEKQIEKASQQINEVVKLKSTLNSISKVLDANAKIHKVSSGDSLEKIARKYNISIETLKQANGLTSSTIIIGQELKIP